MSSKIENAPYDFCFNFNLRMSVETDVLQIGNKERPPVAKLLTDDRCLKLYNDD
jgi:hypothetical protein